MTVFAGLDLAWTQARPSGICVIEGEGAAASLLRLGTETLAPHGFADLLASFGDDVVAAIDAPLMVEPGRHAERDLARVYGRFHASAYTATRDFLQRMNGMAGPDLAQELVLRGFSLDPADLSTKAGARIAIEVFPHPAHVVFFGLEHIIRYKKGRLADRRAGLGAYQVHLRRYLGDWLPGLLGAPPVANLLSTGLDRLTGREMKSVEDTLDALTCALVALHCGGGGASGFELFGCAQLGHIVVPLPRPAAATSGRARSSPSGRAPSRATLSLPAPAADAPLSSPGPR